MNRLIIDRCVALHPRARIRLLLGAAAALLVGLRSAPVRAHSYPERGFTVIHPWCPEAPKGADGLVVSMQIVEIQTEDRLLAAATPVARAVEWRGLGAAGRQRPGVALRPGTDLTLSAAGAHLLLRGVNTDLRFGYEYPLTLSFERAGAVEAALIVGTH